MTISIPNVTISEDEYVSLATAHWLRQPKNRWPLWIYGFSTAVFVALVGLRLWAKYYDSNASWPVFELSWLAFILLYMLWWRPYRIRQHFRKAYRSAAQNQLPTSYAFGEDGVENKSELMQGTVSYEAFPKAVVRGHWLLLYFSENGFVFIDLRQIQAPATESTLLQLLQRKGVTLA